MEDEKKKDIRKMSQLKKIKLGWLELSLSHPALPWRPFSLSGETVRDNYFECLKRGKAKYS